MKKLILMLGLLLIGSPLFADSPMKIPLSDVNSSVFKSSFCVSRSGGFNASISSGVVSVFFISVGSAGFNSRLNLYDNYLQGSTSNQVDGFLTNVQNTYPKSFQTTRGLIAVSTCQACSGSWSAPELTFNYGRIR